MKRNNEIITCTNEEIKNIIESREPWGLFICKEKEGLYVAVDNSGGDAWTEDFTTQEAAVQYLVGDDLLVIAFNVYCLDRMLFVAVPEFQEEKTNEILEESYAKWCSDNEGLCCEESMLEALESKNIKFVYCFDVDAE